MAGEAYAFDRDSARLIADQVRRLRGQPLDPAATTERGGSLSSDVRYIKTPAGGIAGWTKTSDSYAIQHESCDTYTGDFDSKTLDRNLTPSGFQEEVYNISSSAVAGDSIYPCWRGNEGMLFVSPAGGKSATATAYVPQWFTSGATKGTLTFTSAGCADYTGDKIAQKWTYVYNYGETLIEKLSPSATTDPSIRIKSAGTYLMHVVNMYTHSRSGATVPTIPYSKHDRLDLEKRAGPSGSWSALANCNNHTTLVSYQTGMHVVWYHQIEEIWPYTFAANDEIRAYFGTSYGGIESGVNVVLGGLATYVVFIKLP